MTFKNKAITGTLIGISLAAGLGTITAIKDNKSNITETEEVNELDVVQTNKNIIIVNGMTTLQVAEKSYNEYKEFYDSIGVSIEDIDTLINVVNDNTDGYTLEQLEDSLAIVRNIELSDNVIQSIDNINASKISELPYEGELCTCIPSPKISDFVNISNIDDTITNYESLRDELITEIRQSGTYSEEIAQKIRQATIDMEISQYNKDTSDMNSECPSEGLNYIVASSKYNLAQLCQLVTPNNNYIIADNGIELKLSLSGSELENASIVEMLGDSAPSDVLSKYALDRESLIITKYDESMCSIAVEIYQNAGYYLQSTNNIENLKALSYKLKEVNEYYTYGIENIDQIQEINNLTFSI